MGYTVRDLSFTLSPFEGDYDSRDPDGDGQLNGVQPEDPDDGTDTDPDDGTDTDPDDGTDTDPDDGTDTGTDPDDGTDTDPDDGDGPTEKPDAGTLPEKDAFEEYMTSPGHSVAEGWITGDNDNPYTYDFAYACDFIIDYRNGDSTMEDGRDAWIDFYTDFVNNNGAASYGRYPIALYNAYQRSGRNDILSALRYIANEPYIRRFPDEPLHTHRSREVAYGLLCLVFYERAVGRENMSFDSGYQDVQARYESALMHAESHLYQWRFRDFLEGRPEVEYMRPFMVGLTAYCLAKYYEDHGNSGWPTGNWASIPDGLIAMLGWMREDATCVDEPTRGVWDENGLDGQGGFCYTDQSEDTGGKAVAADVSNLIAPGYAFLFHHTHELKWQEYADACFRNRMTHGYFSSSAEKQYAQAYTWMDDFFRWRGRF